MNKCLRIVFCTVIASIIVILSSVSYAASGLDDTVQPANGNGPTHQTIVGNKNGEDPANCYAFALGAKMLLTSVIPTEVFIPLIKFGIIISTLKQLLNM